MNTKPFFLLLLLLLAAEAFPQAAGNVIYEKNNRYQQNEMYNQDLNFQWNKVDPQQMLLPGVQSDNVMIFEVNALMNVEADSYLAIFNVSQIGETAEKVDEIVNKRISNFKSSIKTIGVSETDIYTDMISLVPYYDYEVEKTLFSTTYTEVPKGFEMQKNIHVRYTNSAILDKIVTLAAQNEIYDLVKVEYIVNDVNAVYDTLRQEAINVMNKKIEDFKALGIDLDTVYHILVENKSVAYPVDRYTSYQAHTGVSLAAIDKRTTVTPVRKPKTMFYNKIPYHNYDIVLNPDVIEPLVQFAYKLKVKYLIKEKTKKQETIYKWLTPDGQVRTIKID